MDEQRTSQLITVAFVRSVKMCWVIYSCNTHLNFALSFDVELISAFKLHCLLYTVSTPE